MLTRVIALASLVLLLNGPAQAQNQVLTDSQMVRSEMIEHMKEHLELEPEEVEVIIPSISEKQKSRLQVRNGRKVVKKTLALSGMAIILLPQRDKPDCIQGSQLGFSVQFNYSYDLVAQANIGSSYDTSAPLRCYRIPE